jgi:hypothetical protein
VANLVARLGELTERYAVEALRGDPETFRRLAAQQTAESRRLTQSYAASTLRGRAERARHAGDHAAVVQAYTELSLLDTITLTSAELARLRYSRRQLPERSFEALERRLRALDPLVAELTAEETEWYREYLDHGEYGLAVEVVAEALTESMPQHRLRLLAAGLHAEAMVMELPDVTIDRLRDLM